MLISTLNLQLRRESRAGAAKGEKCTQNLCPEARTRANPKKKILSKEGDMRFTDSWGGGDPSSVQPIESPKTQLGGEPECS